MRQQPPFRAEHVGSLLRPPEVLKARDDYAQSRLSMQERRRIEDDAIRRLVRMQEDVGLQTVTDGEVRQDDTTDRMLFPIPYLIGYTPSAPSSQATWS